MVDKLNNISLQAHHQLLVNSRPLKLPLYSRSLTARNLCNHRCNSSSQSRKLLPQGLKQSLLSSQHLANKHLRCRCLSLLNQRRLVSIFKRPLQQSRCQLNPSQLMGKPQQFRHRICKRSCPKSISKPLRRWEIMGMVMFIRRKPIANAN